MSEAKRYCPIPDQSHCPTTSEVTPTRCWASYSNGFCFRNRIPCSFDYLIYPYYPAYTMGCYQIVINGDNGSADLLFVLLVCGFYNSTKGGEMQLHFPAFLLSYLPTTLILHPRPSVLSSPQFVLKEMAARRQVSLQRTSIS